MHSCDRSDILIIETAQEYLVKKSIAIAKARKEAEIYKKKVEAKGVCEGCGIKSEEGYRCRWVHNDEFYLCSDCFIHDLQCQAEVTVPRMNVKYMEEFNEYINWEDLWWEEEIEKNKISISSDNNDNSRN
jgi:hypothetical protein